MALIILLLILHQSNNFAYGVPLAPALYVFGDSLVDDGNNNFLQTLVKANFPPYGANFAAGPTGRFTNGRTTADFIVEFLKLPYPPPRMSIETSSPITGLNYASGSCGILPQTGKPLGRCLSLDEQIGLFATMATSTLPNQFRSKIELLKYLSNSIFYFSIGSNDYIGNYLDTTHFNSSKIYTPQQFGQILVNKLSQSLQRMYNLGGRKFVIADIGLIGCIPAIVRNSTLKNEKCVEQVNQLASIFNKNLASMIQKLSATLPGSKLVYAHANQITSDIITNPSKYGLKDTSNTCCVTSGSGCTQGLKSCSNPDQVYFFDSYHPTEIVYSIMASHCITDKSVCSPTLNQLVNM